MALRLLVRPHVLVIVRPRNRRNDAEEYQPGDHCDEERRLDVVLVIPVCEQEIKRKYPKKETEYRTKDADPAYPKQQPYPGTEHEYKRANQGHYLRACHLIGIVQLVG
jgi:hypothetical protein